MKRSPAQWARWLKEHGTETACYEPFIERGDLVFDIGANRGMKTTAFLKLGARVVAVDPILGIPKWRAYFDAALADRSGQVNVESVAVSDKPGHDEFHINEVFPGFSTFSDKWMRLSGQGRFTQTRDVEFVTLETLIEKHGHPSFAKIDVEGWEGHVLKGLMHPIWALSFEFHRRLFDDTILCAEQLHRLARYEYNYCAAGTGPFVLPKWLPGNAMMKHVEGLPQKGPESWGDIFARRVVE